MKEEATVDWPSVLSSVCVCVCSRKEKVLNQSRGEEERGKKEQKEYSS